MKKYNNFKTKEDRKKFYLSKEWRRLRLLVLDRDRNECTWCKVDGKVTTVKEMVLEVDHIEELQDRPDLALDIKNCRVLCKLCHNKRHGRVFIGGKKKKNKWQDERW